MSTEKDKPESAAKKYEPTQHPPANRVRPETSAKPGSVKTDSRDDAAATES